MDNKILPATSLCKFKTKALLFLSLFFTSFLIQAQCPCTSSGCTTTISTTVSTNFTVTAGQTLCIVPGGNITGSITVNGGTVNNSSTITPSALNYTFYGTINNCGTITGSFNINMDGATDILYNCSGGTLHLTGSKNITMNGGGYFKNDGQIILDGGDILDQGGDMFINNGTITINSGGDFTVNGQNNGFCNNGTINMTDVGSRFLGNGDGSSNHGILNTYDFDLNGNNFYNACTINVVHDFFANGGSMTGPTTAGQYGRYNITGSSGYNGTNIGLGGSHVDICDAGHPAGNWDSKNGGSIGANVTYCVNTGTCVGTGSCTIPCTMPVPSIAGTSTICPGVSTVLTGGGSGTYVWNDGSTTSTITVSPSSTTTYTLTVTNSCGSTTKAQVVTVNSTPTPGITGSAAICNGTNTTLTGSGGGTYSWSPGGATTASITVTPGSTTTYTITVTNGSGCTASTNKVLTVNPIPTPTITGGTEPICNGSNTTLTGGGGGTYSWLPGGATSTAITVTPGSTSTYTVTVTASGCSSKATQVVTVNANPTPGITGTATICNGKSTTLTGTGGGTYSWSPGGAVTTAISVSPGASTTYTVIVTNAAGCTATAVQAVTVNINPTAGITGTTTICNGVSTTLTGTGGGTYVWSTTDVTTAITVTPGASTTYTITVSNGFGCTATKAQAVTVNALPTATMGSTPAACGGSNGTATVTATGTATLTYSWTPSGQTTPIAVGLSSGGYTVKVTDGNGCTKNGSVSVNNATGPTASLSSQSNVLCTGSATGSATVTGTGGTGTLTYSWSPGGQTTTSITGLTAGTYICTVTDVNGCAQGQSVTITQPASSISSGISSQLNVGCTGAATGSATVTATGGTGAFTYNWSPTGGTNSTATGLTTGSYNVTITDANGCTKQQTIAITQPASALGSNISSKSNVGCTGAATGTATVTGTGGTPTYTYNWNTGATTASVNGLTTGTYSVTITDANGCTKQQTVAITQPASALGSTISGQSNVGCTGAATGTATVTGTGGTPAYTYNWSTGETTSSVSGLTMGTYSVVVTDNNGCTKQQTVVITQPASAIGSTISSQNNVGCTGAATGSATVTGTGGTPAYTYNWSTGATTASVSGLTTGSYNVTVTDANGCTSVQTVAITQPASAVGSSVVSQTDVDCKGNATGDATITATGGTPGYTYNWSPTGGTNSNATGLTAGNYNVTITDANGCTKVQAVTVDQPLAPLSSSVSSQSNVGCTGSATGTASVTGTGGTPNYTYTWLPGGSNGPNAANLTAGTYTVSIVDIKGCSTDQIVTITQPASVIGTTTSAVNATCGNSNGTASITASGGTPTPGYTYSWSPIGGTNSNATGLSAGGYIILVTDGNGCTATAGVSVNNAGSPTVGISSQIPVACTGNATGSASVTVTGGTPGYSYNWTPMGGTGSSATGLTVGTYNCTVTDFNGCIKVQSVVITQPASGLGSTISSQDNVGCTGSATGSATVTGTGGTPTYTYLWSPGANTTAAVTGLTAGTYSVTITDNNGCTKQQTVSITQPASVINATISSKANVGCTGSATGSATVTVTGGTPSYTYSWAPGGNTTSVVTGLTVGSYVVTVTDFNGCTSSQSVAITQPASGLSSTIVGSLGNVGCTGSATGSATVTGVGGTPNYFYNWNTGKTTSSVSNLTAGTYSVTVTDNNGCTSTQSVIITEPTNVLSSTIVGSLGNVGCTGSATGSATVTGVGGTPNYVYNWNTGETTSSVSNLTAGTYSVTVTDNNGCTATQSVIITQPATVLTSTVVGSVGNVGCTGSATGSATVTGIGGTPNYVYNWNTGETTSSVSNLTAGTYSVTITDNNGCTSTQSVVITQPTNVLSSTIVGSLGNVGCTGSSTGSATITGVGGTPNYIYNWNTGETTSSISNLTAGTYSVTVTDNNGCTATQSIVITQPASVITATTSSTNAACGSSNGTVNVTGSGGTPGYNYAWSNGKTTAAVSGLTAGTYTVTVADTNGCTYTVTAIVNGSPGPTLTVSSKSNITCNGLIDGTATVTVSSGTAPYTYTWTPNAGNNSTLTGLSANTYTIVVSDSASCKDTTVVTITEPLPITFALTTGGASVCTGQSITLLTTSLTGGSPPFTFNWLPNGPLVTPLVATTYSVTVTDSSGCISQMDTIRIVPFTSPIAGFDTLASGMFHQKYNFTDLSTNGNNWYWDFGDGATSTLQNPFHTYPGAGTYTVTQIVTNSSGCADTITKIVVILPNIIIPNVFTPNHDGVNDEFWIPSSGFKSFELTIYDRWGLKLFSTDAGEIRWDGRTSAGQEVPDGTYYYLLKAVLRTDTDGKNYESKGFIDLHRSNN